MKENILSQKPYVFSCGENLELWSEPPSVSNIHIFSIHKTLCEISLDGFCNVYFQELTNITMLSTFVHLRYIDISMNSIKDISPLNCLTHMLTLKSDRNLLASPALAQLPYLQSANFAKNKIIAAEGLPCIAI